MVWPDQTIVCSHQTMVCCRQTKKKTGEKQQKSGQEQQKNAAELPPKQPRQSRKGDILFRPTDERNHNPNLPRRTWYGEAQKANAAGSEKAANRPETHEK